MALAELEIIGTRATITLNRPAKHNVIEAADELWPEVGDGVKG